MYAILMRNTTRRVVVALLRLYLHVARKHGLLCRGCGATLPIDGAWEFVDQGCQTCGSHKLEAR